MSTGVLPGRRGALVGAVVLLLVTILIFAGCAPEPTGATGTEIVEASEVSALLEQSDAVLVDTRSMPEYNETHIDGAVNVSRADIVVMQPYPDLVAPAEKIERNLGRRGISNDTLVIAYDDNNNMDAARLWWTLKAYGHDEVKVVSGGLNALQEAGFAMSSTAPEVTEANFTAEPLNEDMLVAAPEIRESLDEPRSDVVLVDVRSEEEHLQGHIPGSIHINYEGNNFSDGTFRPVNHIRINYIQEGIDYEKEVWLYCRTSIRGAQTYLTLYNAGYRNLRLYDGAWLAWSANPINPVFVPDTTIQMQAPDQS